MPGFSFLNDKSIIEEGDVVVVYINPFTAYSVNVERGKTLNMKYGSLRHEYLIGKRYGTQISATAGYVYALRPSPNLWTRVLQRQTQIIYTPDISMILMLLDLKSGSIVCETGTGSGSLTHAIATAIAPKGRLYSYDIEQSRVKMVEGDLKKHGLDQFATIVQRNVCTEGFSVDDICDAIFLDLPEPWEVIGFAKNALNSKRIGRIVNFSPCIEQVQRVCAQLERNGFVQVQTVEIVPRKYKVAQIATEPLIPSAAAPSSNTGDEVLPKAPKKRKLESGVNSQTTFLGCYPFPYQQPTHTSYLTSATIIPPY